MTKWPRRHWRPWDCEEEPKDIEAVPETLGYGDEEKNPMNGELIIYLQRQPAHWVTIGKFQDDRQFYVADRLDGSIVTGEVTYHDHLLLAVSRVAELITGYNHKRGLP